ncbi:unnamed protein product [Pleuronectes platessa]|uniref:Uncharacterized protein n=1 Tax=Pleuronectes platessa TaxID=8262 RepID=A0A9N7ZDN9_PLEPL|nr:unnamed protein product [Pleuronectes platessa]
MGSGPSQRETPVTESPPPSQPCNHSESDSVDSSPRPPSILITAPSRENLHVSTSTMTLADSVKERRPASSPFVVGKKPVTTAHDPQSGPTVKPRAPPRDQEPNYSSGHVSDGHRQFGESVIKDAIKECIVSRKESPSSPSRSFSLSETPKKKRFPPAALATLGK